MALDRSLIAHLPTFDGFSDGALEEILTRARSQRFPKNTMVFQQGSDAESFFLLLHGRVRAFRIAPSGEQLVIRFVGPGEMFGVARAIGKSAYPANALAVVDSVALVWPTAYWPDLMQRYPSLAGGMMQMLGQQLQEQQTRLAEVSNHEVERRVANALLRLAAQGGRKGPEGIDFDFPISRQDIAEMTGTTFYTVSRILAAWEAAGVVATGRQKVAIRDPHRLTLLAEGSSD